MSILAVCPLLAAATTTLTGITMGLANLFILIMTTLSVSACRRFITHSFKLPAVLIISVTWVIVLDLFLQACWYEMREALGIYLPLIALNSFILLRLEQGALTSTPLIALKDAFSRGIVIFMIISALSASRELLGLGGLFSDADALLGVESGNWALFEGGFTIVYQAPGALFGLGLLVALYNRLSPQILVKHAD